MTGEAQHGLVMIRSSHEDLSDPTSHLLMPWHTEAPPTSIQIKDAGDATESPDGTVRRPVIGPLARADTFMQLEGTDIEFTREADVSIPIDRKRCGIAYVLRGSGMIEKNPVEMGHGALFESVSKVALYGSPGFRVFLATVPVVEGREDTNTETTRKNRGV